MGLLQFGRRIDTQFRGERFPSPLVDRQRVGLPPTRGQGADPQGGQPFTQWPSRTGGFEIGENLAYPACPQLRVEVFLLGGGAQLVQPARGELGERCGGQVGQGRTAPQCERGGQRVGGGLGFARRQFAPAPAERFLEAERIDVLGPHAQPVSTRRQLDHPRIRHGPAQPGDQRLQRTRRIDRRLGAPQSVDQAIDGHRAPTLQRQPRQQHAQPQTTDSDRLPVIGVCGEGAEYCDTHALSIPDAGAAFSASRRLRPNAAWISLERRPAQYAGNPSTPISPARTADRALRRPSTKRGRTTVPRGRHRSPHRRRPC